MGLQTNAAQGVYCSMYIPTVAMGQWGSLLGDDMILVLFGREKGGLGAGPPTLKAGTATNGHWNLNHKNLNDPRLAETIVINITRP